MQAHFLGHLQQQNKQSIKQLEEKLIWTIGGVTYQGAIPPKSLSEMKLRAKRSRNCSQESKNMSWEILWRKISRGRRRQGHGH